MNRTEAAAVLGVAPSASRDEVQSAFRSHARLLHPDRFSTAPEEDRAVASVAMQRLIRARAVLLHKPGADSSASSASTGTGSTFQKPRQREDPRPSQAAPPRSQQHGTTGLQNPYAAPKQAHSTPNTPWPNTVSWALFIAAGFSAVLSLFGPPGALGPMGAAMWVFLLLGWAVRATGRASERSHRNQTHHAREYPTSAHHPYEQWRREKGQNIHEEAGPWKKPPASGPGTHDRDHDHDASTDYGDLQYWGGVQATLDMSGRLQLNTRAHDFENAYAQLVAADAARIMACLSSWVTVLGQASRQETGVTLEVLLGDLDQIVDEIIESSNYEDLPLEYPNKLPHPQQSVSATASTYITPDLEMLSLWRGLQSSLSDSATLRVFACRLLESSLCDMHFSNARQMIWIGCSAISAAVKNDPSLLADTTTEAMLAANVYRFAENCFNGQGRATSRSSTATEQGQDFPDSGSEFPYNAYDTKEPEANEFQSRSSPNDSQRAEDPLDTIDQSPVIIWGTGPWIYPEGRKVTAVATPHSEGIDVELPEEDGLHLPWGMVSSWHHVPTHDSLVIHSLGLRIQLSGKRIDQWKKVLNDHGIFERNK